MSEENCMLDSLSICQSIEGGFTEVIAELKLIREEMEKHSELLTDISVNVED